MEPEGSLLHSQVPATCLYPEAARSSPYTHIQLPVEPSSYYPPIYACLQSGLITFRMQYTFVAGRGWTT